MDGFLGFDREAFGISHAEAELTDPQHRIILEACYRAVESSGEFIGCLRDRVGVFLGARPSDYGSRIEFYSHSERDIDKTMLAIGSSPDYIASRVSYTFGLTGPSMAVQAACSSSCVATHLACQAILAGECDSALAGGVAVELQDAGYTFTEGGIYSPRGRCEPYMISADGTVEGNGVAVLFLRRLDLALAQGNPVLGVIAGTAVNNDGRERAGFAAPGVAGQVELISEALGVAGLEASRIALLEGHGTGTSIGDALEIEAASRAFRSAGAGEGDCRLHSVKANVGHLAAAAGAAGIISCLLALRHEAIPPNAPLVQGARPIDTRGTPFTLTDKLTDWPRAKEGRYAAVSSFGLGGTNAHIIVSDAGPELRAVERRSRSWQLLPLSAADSERLVAVTGAARNAVAGASAEARADIGHTLRVGRPELAARATALIPTDGSIASMAWPTSDVFHTVPKRPPSVVFLLPGQGGRSSDAARVLYETEPAFRSVVNEGLAVMETVLAPEVFTAVRRVFQDGGLPVATNVLQPVLHLVSTGLHAFLASLGVTPDVLAGHSAGELTAAHLGGVLSAADAARAVCWRGQAMADMPPGAMVAVRAGVDELASLPGGGEVAVVNGHRSIVVGAAAEAMPEVLGWLTERGLEHQALATSHAFHHATMTDAAARFGRRMRDIALHAPAIPVLSGITGSWLSADQARDPGYWGRQVRERVVFGSAMSTVAAEHPGAVYLQLNGETNLLRAAQMGGAAADSCLALMRSDDSGQLLRAVGGLWERGVPIDWASYAEHDHARRVDVVPRTFLRIPYLHPALLDRCPALDPAEPSPARPHGGPATGALSAEADKDLAPVLDAVSECWESVLGTSPLPGDDFFDSGGDSITASRLVVRLRSYFSVEIPLGLPLVERTPRAIARALDEILLQVVAEE
jgi:phthiocerol/phenolphthiocerol synthesis type-I polyketide synthase E